MVLPARGDAHEVAALRSSHPGQDEDLVTLGDHVVDCHPCVVKRRVEHLEQLPHPGLPRREAWHLLVLDVVVRDEFVDRGEIARADPLEELTCQGLVGIGLGSGHWLAFLRRWHRARSGHRTTEIARILAIRARAKMLR